MYNVECKEEGRKSSPKVVVIDYSSVRSLPFRSLYANVKLLLTGNGRPLLPVAVHFDDSNVSSATKKDLFKKNEPLESRTCERNITRSFLKRKEKNIFHASPEYSCILLKSFFLFFFYCFFFEGEKKLEKCRRSEMILFALSVFSIFSFFYVKFLSYALLMYISSTFCSLCWEIKRN